MSYFGVEGAAFYNSLNVVYKGFKFLLDFTIKFRASFEL